MPNWLKTMIGDKPIWVVVAAAMLASVGTLTAQALWKAAGEVLNSQAELVFLVQDGQSRPLEGAVIQVLDADLEPMQFRDGETRLVSGEQGSARAVIGRRPPPAVLRFEYMFEGEPHFFNEPMRPLDGTTIRVIFDPDIWYTEKASVSTTPVSSFDWLNLGPTWLRIAANERGQAERPNGDNPRILEYIRSVNPNAALGEDVGWSSAFVNWVMTQAGLVGTQSMEGRSWLSWGAPSRLTPGCVAVFWRDSPDGNSTHVGFFLDETESGLQVLGGNQSNAVQIATFSRSRFLGCRMPRPDRRDRFNSVRPPTDSIAAPQPAPGG